MIRIRILFICLVAVIGGCKAITPNEARVTESRVLGMDLSIPLPGSEGLQNIINLKFGWCEMKYAHTKQVDFKSNSEHTDIDLLKGKGSVKRQFEIK